MSKCFLVSVCAVLLSACESQKVPTTYYEADTPGYVESIVVDESRQVGYMGTQGDKLDVSGRKGKGLIVMTGCENGAPVRRNVTKPGVLHSPRALTLHGGLLYAADRGRIVSVDTKSGKVSTVADLSKAGVESMHDATWAGERMFVSSQTKNRIYEVNPATGKFAEVQSSEPFRGPKGLTWDDGAKRLLVCEYGSGEKVADGRILSLDPATGKVEQVCGHRGKFSGLALNKGFLYFSDWNRKSRQPGAVCKMDLKSGKVEAVTRKHMNGAADFCVTKDGVVVVPALFDKKLWIIYPKQEY
ncbi:PQQ-binding-like beta-propeller repeat protein [Akkermansia glycaniphila]|uniref:outer membrane protein assembly factor BamB family protein n=1 Tax=Akkermansia glycaniphila TaxID=1679444 RepID=UPI001C01368A|nr:PQQ-binding-like beta-propeller repeat protein [Akkermansia glycaniphila]MBT9450533.1 PQQ-binding-like beta-propeller repeat protein [Akkermansia glycaniphila]